MSSAAKLANFDPAVGSTVNTGIDEHEAHVPDATQYMKETAYVAFMTPMDDPNDINCRWGAPVIYWGLPSTAKSDGIDQAAIEACLQCETIYPGQQQPEDFSGVLFPSASGPTVECLLEGVRRLNALGRGVVFLDEINNASKATEGAMLGFIQKRIIAGKPLAPGIRMIAAANPPKWSVNGFQLAPATANRFCHLQVKCPPLDNYINYLLDEYSKPKFSAHQTEDIIRHNWSAAYGHAKAKLVGYLRSQPTALHRQPQVEDQQSGFCWASPRTLRLGIRMTAAAEILGYKDEISNLLLAGCVGEGVAFDMMHWIRNADLPTPAEVIQNNWSPDQRRLDVAYAVLTSVTQYVIGATDRQTMEVRGVGGWQLLGRFVQANMGDMVINSAKAFVGKNLSRAAQIPELAKASDSVILYLGANKLLAYAQTT